MIRKRILIGVLLVAVLLGVAPGWGMAAPQVQTPAPLKNPGFEGLSCRPGSVPPACLDNWTRETFDGSQPGNVYTPQGWVTWWRTGGQYGQPAVEVIPNVPPFTGERPRIRNGFYATRVYISWHIVDAGLFQTVSGLTPGATVQFSAYGHTWSCTSLAGDRGFASSCGGENMMMQIGIAPDGSRDFNSPSIVWSPPQSARDTYTLIGPVTAQVGPAGSVTVFLRANSRWGFQYQEAYWDDASLVYTAQPAAPTATPAVPPGQPIVIAGADGLNVRAGPGTNFPILVHVKPGTQFRVTGRYGNWWQIDYHGRPAWAYSGVVIAHNTANVPQVVPPPSPTPAHPAPTPIPPTPTPIPTEVPLPTPTPTAEATPTPVSASICVSAYHDRNGDTFHNDPAVEELLPNAEIVVANASGVIARHKTDGVSEPYCFTVAPGTYRLVQTSPPGYVSSGPAEQIAAVTGGATLSLQFGNVRDQRPAATVTVEAPRARERHRVAGSDIRIFSTIAKVSGALVLFLAFALAILFVLSRRRL